MKKDIIPVTLAVTGIMFLQFLIVPLLGDIDNAGKLYFFAFAILIISLHFFYTKNSLTISPVVVGFILILLTFLLSAWHAVDSYWAFLQSGLLALCLLFLLLFTHWTVQQPLLYEKLIDGLLFFGVASALLGLYEYSCFLSFGPTRHALIPYLLPPNTSLRVAGPYGQPNLFAVFLTVTLLAFFYRYLRDASIAWCGRFSWLRFIPFFLVAVVFFQTGSRAGMMSFLVVFGILSWFVVSRRYLNNNPTAKQEFVRLLLCLACAFLFYRVFSWLYVTEDSVRSFGNIGLSGDARYVFWMSAILIFLDNPWFGIGLDNFGFVQDAYGPAAHKTLGFVPYEAMGNTDWAHNELLQILSEGGIVAFALIVFLLGLFLYKFWHNFMCSEKPVNPLFLFSHLFLFPFIIQSMFSWPFRSPPLLILFFACLGGLLAQYPLRVVHIPPIYRKVICLLPALCLVLTVSLFIQELRIGSFKQKFIEMTSPVDTLDELKLLTDNPYSAYRVLSKTIPGYTRRALAQESSFLAAQILPFCEQLVDLEGARWQWYNLARLYLKVGREEDSRSAIKKAIDLMPSDKVTWAFLHYLNMLNASRDTGKPLESFWPLGQQIDFSKMELLID